MEFIVLRKLIGGIAALLIATGIIKWGAVKKHLWLRTVLYALGIALIVFAMLYQFNIIPESNRDVLFEQIK